jgi:hypothetical protein
LAVGVTKREVSAGSLRHVEARAAASSTVWEPLKQMETAGLSWPLPEDLRVTVHYTLALVVARMTAEYL